MQSFFDEVFRRPMQALAAGLEMLGSSVAEQRVEAAVARLAHTMSVGQIGEEVQSVGNPVTTLTDEFEMPTRQSSRGDLHVEGFTADLEHDARLLPSVEEYLARGLALKRWWDEVERTGGPENRFPLERTFNQPTRSFGFYGDAPVGEGFMPVMGNVQEMFYDRTRAPVSLGRDSAEWMWTQIREFVMKYFMRVSSFRLPETYVDATNVSRWERRPYIALAEMYGAEAEALFFDVPLEVCKQRNRGRSRIVPEYALDLLARRMTPPSLDEGFARITRIPYEIF